jgi:ribonuclease HI
MHSTDILLGMEEWIHGWIRNGWKKSDGKPVLNAPLIRYLSALLDERAYSRQTVRFHHYIHPRN